MYKCTYVLKDSKKKRGTLNLNWSFKCQVKSLKAITLCPMGRIMFIFQAYGWPS